MDLPHKSAYAIKILYHIVIKSLTGSYDDDFLPFLFSRSRRERNTVLGAYIIVSASTDKFVIKMLRKYKTYLKSAYYARGASRWERARFREARRRMSS